MAGAKFAGLAARYNRIQRIHFSTRSSRAAGITTSTSVISATVAMVVNILMARILGPEARGQVAWILQASYLLAPMLALGVDRLALRGNGTGQPIPRAHIWLLGSISAVGSYFIGGFTLSAVCIVAMVGANLAVERGAGMFSGKLQAYFILHTTVQLWTLISSAALFFVSQRNVTIWIMVYVLPAGFLFVFWTQRRLYGSRSTAGKQTARVRIQSGLQTYRSAYGYIPGAVSALVAARIERLLLPIFASSAALGLYVSVATASELLLWIAQGLSESKVGTQVGRHASRVDIAKTALRDMAIYSAAGLLLAVAIRIILLPALGPSFAAASTLILPLCLASAAWATYRQVVASWIALANAKKSSILEAGGAILTTVLALVAIAPWGALGAALACLSSYLIMIAASIAFWPAAA